MQLFLQIGELGPSWFHVAIRTLVLLSHSEVLLKSHIIANILGAEPTFIRKILKRLAKDGIVITQGGRNGGYSLNKKPEDITVGEIYRLLTKGSPVNIFSVKQTGVEAFISMIISKAENKFMSILDEYTIFEIKKYAFPSLSQTYMNPHGSKK